MGRQENLEDVKVEVSTENLTPATAPEAPKADDADEFTPVTKPGEKTPEAPTDEVKAEDAKTDENASEEAPKSEEETAPAAPEVKPEEKAPEAPKAEAKKETKAAAPAAVKKAEAKKTESKEGTVKVQFHISVAYRAAKYAKGDVAELLESDLANLKKSWYSVI